MRLFFRHPFAQSFEPFLGRLFDVGHVLRQMLLGVDLPVVAPLLLSESELPDRFGVLVVEVLPDGRAPGLLGGGISIAGWIGVGPTW